jgi:uncharacterized SAM-binding protein YcdF (DUF218 family)
MSKPSDLVQGTLALLLLKILAREPLHGWAISQRLRVAEFAADLYHRSYGSILVCSGGIAHENDLLTTPWKSAEAKMYAQAAESRGVPDKKILLETRAKNSRFSRDLIAEHMQPRNIVIVVKPFMQRRVWATLAVEWPEMPSYGCVSRHGG